MNILYCGDRNIEDGLTISVLSLLKNVKEELKIYVLTMDFKNEAKEYKGVPEFIINALDEKVKEKNVQNFVTKIDITDLFKKELPIKNIKTRFTPYCMLRLFTDEINEMPNKILYLDTDVICRKDFSEFYNQDISNYEIVGVLDHYGKWFFRNNLLKKDYINSGVLLLNEVCKKRLYIIGQETNLAMTGMIGFFMNYSDIIPISNQISYMKKEFPEVIKEKLQKGNLILIYPEQEMWFNYKNQDH